MDMEKVIDELNTDVLPFLQHHCDMQCDREKRWISKMIITIHDALSLLKKQEPAEPILDSFLHKRCPSCRALLKGKYCHECGQAVKWE